LAREIAANFHVETRDSVSNSLKVAVLVIV
jgi:hypothetical protein